MRSTIFTLGALLMAGAAFTACSSEDEVMAVPAEGQTWQISIPATKGIDADTRALVLDGKTLKSEWSVGDEVYVVKGSYVDSQTLKADRSGSSANLTGDLAGEYAVGDELTLVLGFFKLQGDNIYKWLSYNHVNNFFQKGTFESVQNFDFASATVEVTAVDGGTITTTAAYFKPCQSIFRLSFTDGTNPIKAKEVKISDFGYKFYLTYDILGFYESTMLEDFPLDLLLDTPSSEVFIALRVDESVPEDVVSFRVEDADGYIYEGTKTATADMPVNGKYYSATIELKPTGEHNTLKITPEENYTRYDNGNYGILGNVTISGSGDVGSSQFAFGTGLSVTFDNASLVGNDFASFSTYRGKDQTFILNGKNTMNFSFSIFRSQNLTFKGTGSLEGFKVEDEDLELFKNGTKIYDLDNGSTLTGSVNYEDGLKFIDNGDGTYSIKAE